MESKDLILLFVSGTLMVLFVLRSLLAFVVLHRNRILKIQIAIKQAEIEKEKKVLESLIEGEEKERKRISAELHDGLGARLSALKMEMESNKVVPAYLVERLNAAIVELREMSHNLQPDYLPRVGLINAMERHVALISSHTTTKFIFSAPSLSDLEMGRYSSLNLFRIFTELINNILKHAKATEVFIQFSSDVDSAILTIEDDGIGFSLDEANPNTGIGLRTIQERINLLNAEMHIEGLKGTLVTIKLPLHHLKD